MVLGTHTSPAPAPTLFYSNYPDHPYGTINPFSSQVTPPSFINLTTCLVLLSRCAHTFLQALLAKQDTTQEAQCWVQCVGTMSVHLTAALSLSCGPKLTHSDEDCGVAAGGGVGSWGGGGNPP
jgi:hypothetical protein